MEFWHQFIAIFISLFVITDPFGNIGIFLSITDGDDAQYRRTQALKGSIYSFLLMFVFFIGGTYIMHFFGITLDGIRIGGGLIVSRIGFSLLSPKEEDSHSKDEKDESKKKADISFCPLALPLIAGPGALAVVIAASAKIGSQGGNDVWYSYIAISLAIASVSFLTWLCLRHSGLLLHLLGVNGMNAITRIMGFLLICIAIQMMITGTEHLLHSWGMISDNAHHVFSSSTKSFAF
jgi:multiple antibiotic resistance protein